MKKMPYVCLQVWWLLPVIMVIIIVIAGWVSILFDNLTNIHFKGTIGISDWPVYVFLKKQVDPVLATYKDLPIDYSSEGYPVDEATYKKLPDAITFFSKVPLKMAIAQAKTEKMSGGFDLAIPRKNLQSDNILVFVADKRPKLWYRMVRISKDIQFHPIDLDSAAIVSCTGRYYHDYNVMPEPVKNNSRKH